MNPYNPVPAECLSISYGAKTGIYNNRLRLLLASVCSPIRAMEVSGVDPVEALVYDSLIVISVPVSLHRLPLIDQSPYTLRPHFRSRFLYFALTQASLVLHVKAYKRVRR